VSDGNDLGETTAFAEVGRAIGILTDLGFANSAADNRRQFAPRFVQMGSGQRRANSALDLSKHTVSQFAISLPVQISEKKTFEIKCLERGAPEQLCFGTSMGSSGPMTLIAVIDDDFTSISMPLFFRIWDRGSQHM
jgi:hypothetical protein